MKRMLLKKGFTLIETIVALALIVAAVVGPLSLISSGLANAKTSKNRLVAAHLAQEGVEIVRGFRDFNVLNDSPTTPVSWRGALPDGGSIDDPGCMTDVGGIQLAAFAGGYEVDAVDCLLTAYSGQPLAFDQTGGANNNLFLRALNCAAPGCTPTIFRRKVTITDFSGALESAAGETIPNSDKFTIASQVTWEERGMTKSVTVTETIYNWR